MLTNLIYYHSCAILGMPEHFVKECAEPSTWKNDWDWERTNEDSNQIL